MPITRERDEKLFSKESRPIREIQGRDYIRHIITLLR
jgi:hypothetical protein